MTRKSLLITFAVLAVLCIALYVGFIAPKSNGITSGEAVKRNQEQASEQAKPLPSAAPKTAENKKQETAAAPKAVLPVKSIGKANAPIVMYIFASYTCGHCAHFSREVVPEITKTYVDTGVIRLVYADFPLDLRAAAASLLTFCAPEDKYPALSRMIYDNMSIWAPSEHFMKILSTYGQMNGISDEKAIACMNDEPMLEALNQARKDYIQRYQITSTPTLVFMTKTGKQEKIAGGVAFPIIQQTVEALLSPDQGKKK